jgi:predicted glycoside hydrolase/deacetylase ChbG (UPF0249 family)
VNRIIVNADDYGMSPSISSSILMAVKNGIINSTSVDVCNEMPHQDARKLCEAGITIGLHLNLTEGSPIGNGEGIPELLDRSGRFRAARLSLQSNVDSASIFSELQLQFDRFRFYFGCAPAHIDSHQHFAYLNPSAFEAILQLAKTSKVPMRSPKPFIHGETLRRFCERLRSRYGLTVPFMPEERAAVLKKLFCRHYPELRSEDLHLDFDTTILKEISSQASDVEMITHPHLENIQGQNGA